MVQAVSVYAIIGTMLCLLGLSKPLKGSYRPLDLLAIPIFIAFWPLIMLWGVLCLWLGRA